jgi:hypothetical protein
MQVAALAVAKYPCELEDSGLAGCQQLLAGEFGRCPQITCGAGAILPHDLGPRGVQMGLVAGGDLENGGFHLDEALFGEKAP